jgi:hypothetical protein
LFALAIVTVVVWNKALRKRAQINHDRRAEIARLEEQKASLDAYRAWRENPGNAITDRQMFTGFALDLQSKLQYEPEQTAAYAALPEHSRQVYALYFALEDEPGKLSGFFSGFGKPLTADAYEAMRRFAGGEQADIFGKMYSAYDPDDESASLIPANVDRWDESFARALDMESIYSRAADCVRGELKAQ